MQVLLDAVGVAREELRPGRGEQVAVVLRDRRSTGGVESLFTVLAIHHQISPPPAPPSKWPVIDFVELTTIL